jgi:beta-glucosidase
MILIRWRTFLKMGYDGLKRLTFVAFLGFSFIVKAQTPIKEGTWTQPPIPFWDDSLPFEFRANDIVSRLTLEEKVQQMMHRAPAIPRLAIPAYDWWNEALHGVARTPYNTTVFPQAMGLAATWDTEAIRRMGDITATEGRAIYNHTVSRGMAGYKYCGLTYWSPNINIFRDPRWGRGQETYGEDPTLTANIGSAYVRGIQGDHPQYLKAAACAKHFAVHSGPEPTRHSDNVNPSPYDLWDTYLPAFETLVTRAKVQGVMCAYNAFQGQPCCASDALMQQILRKQWGFTGYVTSDCWGLDDFVSFHKTHADKKSAAVDALIHGTDLECGQDVLLKLSAAVKQGEIPESAVDTAVKRLFLTRLRLGLFDRPEKVPFASIDTTVLNASEHRQHALEVAQKSIVLLKNENQALPLSKNIKKVAVLGPNAENGISILGNYTGWPSDLVTLAEGIRRKSEGRFEVLTEPGVDFTSDSIVE